MARKNDLTDSDWDRTQVLGPNDLRRSARGIGKIPSLIVIKGVAEGKIFKLSALTLSLGRDKKADICLNDNAISRKHCLLLNSPLTTTLIDLRSSNGTLVNEQKISKVKLRPGDKIVVGKTVLMFQISDADENQYHEKMYQLITVDGLTSLYNRKYMKAQLQILFDTFKKSTPFSVLFIDVDHFKKVNDNHDHITGSNILSELGRIFLSNIRQNDIPCRYGGEEFVVILQNANLDHAVFVAEKLRNCVEQNTFFSCKGKPISITVSIGVAQASESFRNNPSELILKSDEAMYYAKKRGRNLTVFFKEGEDPLFQVVLRKIR